MKLDKEYFDLIKSYKLLANKSLGQNFLVNSDVCSSIVNALNIVEGDKVIEIGAGLGSLSYYLAKNPAEVTLIDVDERMLSFLNDQFKDLDNVIIKRENILKSDLNKYTKVIGNLPYYITTGSIEYILLNAVNSSNIVLMVQKEVAAKLQDKKEISPLSILLNYVAKLEPVMKVSANNFAPMPHVDSAVIRIIPNENIKNASNKSVYKLMCNMFLHRRKTILNCLTNYTHDKEYASQILEKLGTNPLARPEQLGIEFYIELNNILKKKD